MGLKLKKLDRRQTIMLIAGGMILHLCVFLFGLIYTVLCYCGDKTSVKVARLVFHVVTIVSAGLSLAAGVVTIYYTFKCKDAPSRFVGTILSIVHAFLCLVEFVSSFFSIWPIIFSLVALASEGSVMFCIWGGPLNAIKLNDNKA
eukprot:m51a1_g617 hypothetical protein (145) ;mRNA; r:105562-106302